MSLLSDFGDLGFTGGVDCGVQLLRALRLGAQGCDSNSGITAAVDLRQNGSIILQNVDPASPNVPTRFQVLQLDFANKTNRSWVASTTKTSVGDNARPLLHNPITNFWITSNQGFSSTSNRMWQTTDGLNYTDSGEAGIQVTNNTNRLGGGYFDGTTFAYINNNNTFVYTTNGTSWTTFAAGAATVYPAFAGNNRSWFSGYYFMHSSAIGGYKYRTSITGSDTNVTGYKLSAMSANGRYLIRTNTTTYADEYSTDGGASWSAFPVSPIQSGNGSGLSNVRVCSNSGQFFVATQPGTFYCFDFSANVWRLSASIGFNTGLFNGAAIVPVVLQGVECLVCNSMYTEPASEGVYIIDMPKGFN